MRRFQKFLIALVILLIVLPVFSLQAAGFTAGIGPLAWSPDGESLLYAKRKQGVFIVSLDGSEPMHIADGDDFDLSPQWSPDGEYIISTMQPGTQAGIFRTPVTGGEPEPLTEDVGWRPNYYAPNGTQPVFSPDGEHIAFLSQRETDPYTALYVMTADGEDEHVLSALGTVKSITWSPDSRSIAFTITLGDYNGLTDLLIVDLADYSLHILTHEQEVDDGYPASWSPDGTNLLFTVSNEVKRHIERIDIDGENREVILEDAAQPIYSPDGKHILFSSYAANWASLAILSVDEPDAEPIAIQLPGERAYYNAAWSPDGTQIAFVSHLFDEPKSEDITIVNADGSDPQTVVSFPLS
jgi:Tol biopolymer transport system component